MINKESIKAVFIGAGNVASQHINYLREFPDVKIVGIYDVDEETLRYKERMHNVKPYKSLDKMLDCTQPDVAFICIPPYAHGEAEMVCIERRIPFLAEKPVARDIDTARKIASNVRHSKLITSVGYMSRYRYGVQKAKKLLEQFPITMVHGGWIIETPHKDHPWLLQKELSGGQLVEQTTHLFDLIRYLCGEVSEVYCQGTRGIILNNNAYNTDDATGTLVKLQRGIFGDVLSSWSSGLEHKIYLDLLGPEMSIQFSSQDLVQEFNTKILLKNSRNPIIIPEEKNIFAVEDRAFINDVKENNPTEILSDYSEGVKSLEISLAADKSLKCGMPIKLEDKNATFS